MDAKTQLPFLRIPPFPGARAKTLARPDPGFRSCFSDEDVDQLIAAVREARVGGNYWNDDADPDSNLVQAVAASVADGISPELRDAFRRRVLDDVAYTNPFTGEPIGPAEAIAYCAHWRRLIESNRDIRGAIGFAFWKRPTVAPLLWPGTDVQFMSRPDVDGGPVAVWKSRTSMDVLNELEQRGVPIVEVEDGFIRSAGLGADCVPPLSIVVDRSGVHFDPRQPSDLEQMIEAGGFPPDTLERARRLRELIVSSGISKYGASHGKLESKAAGKRQILVTGQVEHDRSVLCGGGEVRTNLDLLRRARAEAPDAHILYKPHPDVEAGHRVGSIPDELCLTLADEIVRDAPISALIDMVDEVHVNTSLAGFEALLRGKQVTTHGVSFYAGWGLTRDLGRVPERRTATRSLEELVAAVLLLYPRYLDPVTGLPCTPEILIHRLSEEKVVQNDGPVVWFRRLQGRVKRALAELRVW